MKSKTRARQQDYRRITHQLQKYADSEVNIRVRNTTTGSVVQFNITRDRKSFHRSGIVRSLDEGRNLIDHYARLRDRFIRFVDKQRVPTPSGPRTLKKGLGEFGITGIYPMVRDGYVLVRVRFYPSRDQVAQTTISARNRTPRETATKIADTLEASIHPDHQHRRTSLIRYVAEQLIAFAKEHNALVDAVTISRHAYRTLYKRARKPDDMPHPDELQL